MSLAFFIWFFCLASCQSKRRSIDRKRPSFSFLCGRLIRRPIDRKRVPSPLASRFYLETVANGHCFIWPLASFSVFFLRPVDPKDDRSIASGLLSPFCAADRPTDRSIPSECHRHLPLAFSSASSLSIGHFPFLKGCRPTHRSSASLSLSASSLFKKLSVPLSPFLAIDSRPIDRLWPSSLSFFWPTTVGIDRKRPPLFFWDRHKWPLLPLASHLLFCVWPFGAVGLSIAPFFSLLCPFPLGAKERRDPWPATAKRSFFWSSRPIDRSFSLPPAPFSSRHEERSDTWPATLPIDPTIDPAAYARFPLVILGCFACRSTQRSIKRSIRQTIDCKWPSFPFFCDWPSFPSASRLLVLQWLDRQDNRLQVAVFTLVFGNGLSFPPASCLLIFFNLSTGRSIASCRPCLLLLFLATGRPGFLPFASLFFGDRSIEGTIHLKRPSLPFSFSFATGRPYRSVASVPPSLPPTATSFFKREVHHNIDRQPLSFPPSFGLFLFQKES